jgi:hypothetical protein
MSNSSLSSSESDHGQKVKKKLKREKEDDNIDEESKVSN